MAGEVDRLDTAIDADKSQPIGQEGAANKHFSRWQRPPPCNCSGHIIDRVQLREPQRRLLARSLHEDRL